MTFNQITLKNLKVISKLCTVSFSLILVLFYTLAFVTLQYTHSINNGGSPKVIQKVLK